MALDMSKYKPTRQKKLPVVLLLDVSGSMHGEKIHSLHDAVVEMIHTFVEQKQKERSIEVAIITFGENVEMPVEYTPVDELEKNGIGSFHADGMTPLGGALRAAKDYMEDPNYSPKGNYTPVVVLVSDGQPNDEWRGPLKNFIETGRTKKAQRFTVGIGSDADEDVLRQFATDDQHMFYAESAGDIADKFRIISTQVTTPSAVATPQVSSSQSGANTQKQDNADEWM